MTLMNPLIAMSPSTVSVETAVPRTNITDAPTRIPRNIPAGILLTTQESDVHCVADVWLPPLRAPCVLATVPALPPMTVTLVAPVRATFVIGNDVTAGLSVVTAAARLLTARIAEAEILPAAPVLAAAWPRMELSDVHRVAIMEVPAMRPRHE